ncbi:MAG: IS4 family transposase [Gammaproteobacteria bacterium]|nr:IS4 family transposase [Gammaproteobacteria bacterium]
MAHHNTVFAQLLKMVPRHRFDGLAERHHVGRRFRKTSRWSQFVALAMGQLSGRHSLRDVVANADAQRSRWYHLGALRVTRSTLARVNEQQPCSFYEALFGTLYQRCRTHRPGHGFRFKNALYSLDSSLIDLSLKLFPWGHFALSKAAIKLHLGLDHRGHLPAFATLTEPRRSDIEVARSLSLPRGSIVVFDKGYDDYSWYTTLTNQGVFFIGRQKRDARYKVVERRKVDKSQGLICDQTIELTGIKSRREALAPLRRVVYRDADTGRRYVFLSNHFGLSASTIAACYRQRWQIELFFKRIKQNLKIKAFLGTSRNAVMTQIWIALCMYLMLAYLKYASKLHASLQTMIRLLQLNLFARRNLMALLRGDPTVPDPPNPQAHLAFT